MKVIFFIERNAALIARSVVLILLFWGLAMVLFAIRPFWHDEWRLIYNLKFKTSAELWGDLAYTQQFPRVYLQLTKLFTSLFHYNYFSLRFPAFFIGTLNVLFSWRLLKRIYGRASLEGCLFVLMIVSNFTFIEYLVQTKHYQMEIFMSQVALWQVMEMIVLFGRGHGSRIRYLLLCMSFSIAPFFSYTYPIAIAPLFLLAFLQLTFWKGESRRNFAWMQLLFPLLLSATAIVVFYLIDVRQLMNDKEMQLFWKFRMAGDEGNGLRMIKNLWGWFAKMGSGLIFELVFGSMGIAAVIYASRKNLKHLTRHTVSNGIQLRIYCLGLVLAVLVLFFAGKLPLSEPKFNAFTIPALSVLIGYFLRQMKNGSRAVVFRCLAVTIFCALSINIVTSIVRTFTLPEYEKRMAIYRATQRAIFDARRGNVPILVTAGVAYPDDINSPMPGMEILTADAVLKAFPAYDPQKEIPVIPIKDLTTYQSGLDQIHDFLPVAIIIGDGYTYIRFENQ